MGHNLLSVDHIAYNGSLLLPLPSGLRRLDSASLRFGRRPRLMHGRLVPVPIATLHFADWHYLTLSLHFVRFGISSLSHDMLNSNSPTPPGLRR